MTEAVAPAVAPAEGVAPAAPAPAPAAAPAPAPAPAPVIPAVGVEPAVEAPVIPEAKAEGTTFTYEPTESPMLDYALEWVGGLGFGPDSPAIKAAGQGNWTLLEAEIARLGDKAVGGDKIIALAKQAMTDLNDKATAAAKATRAACVAAFGGSEEQFDAMLAWATEQHKQGKMEDYERDYVNEALAAGGLRATQAVQLLMSVYPNAKGNVIKPVPTTSAPAAATDATALPELTKATFAKEVRALRAKHGPQFEATAEYKALAARAYAQR